MKKSKKSFPLAVSSLLLAIISSFAVVVQNGSYAVPDSVKEVTQSRLARIISQIGCAFQPASYYVLFFVVLAFIAYYHLIPKIDKKLLKWNIPFSVIATIFFLLCDSYYKTSSNAGIMGSSTAVITSGIKGMGIAVIVFFMYDLVNRICIEQFTVSKKYTIKDFVKLTLIMFACWIPYMVIMSPGSMSPDTRDQFAQALGNSDFCWTKEIFGWQEGDVLFNNHHPVFHTLIIKVFLKFGEWIGSYFVGIELFCIFQCLAFTAALSYCVIKLKSYGMSKRLSTALFLLFALFPLFPFWGMTILKDVPFTILLLVTVILLYDSFKNPEQFKWGKGILLAVVLLLLMLVRNNGFYLMLASLPFIVIHFRKDKKFLVRMAVVILIPMLIFKVGYTGIIFNAAGIHDGSTREMLSVPFQQTARYISQYGDEVTAEEEDAILTILNNNEKSEVTLQYIADRYSPDLSDPVKSLYNESAGKDELIDYFKVWAKQLVKHPNAYIGAFLNLNYSWFSFDITDPDSDMIIYNGVNVLIPELVEGVDNPQIFDGARHILYQAVYLLDKIPVVNCIFEFSFYTWAYVIAFLAMLIRKKHKELLACLPIFANYAICFVGPIAYMRYAIPMAACLPFVIYITFSQKRNCEEQTKNLEDNKIWIK